MAPGQAPLPPPCRQALSAVSEELIEIKRRAENRDKLTERRVGRNSANRKMVYLNLRF